ncbi:pectate lyase [uncultured Draconibacterium sp.]|uniref:pectate lyase n=1 Tax=uncultured Draconibacterium sp. TaxID=1573823 RepID=UPI0032178DF5
MKTKSIKFRYFRIVFVLFALVGSYYPTVAQEKEYQAIDLRPFRSSAGHWYGIKDNSNVINPLPEKPQYKANEITKIADNVLLFQRNNGGWPKNYDMQAILTKEQREKVLRAKNEDHTTFDNSTGFSHINYLAEVYAQTKIEKYKKACFLGIDFVLKAQYNNGGWPQYYPLEKVDYSQRITFNDGAYMGIMKLLQAILDKDPKYDFVSEKTFKKVDSAYKKGLECLLAMQIELIGKPTVWCQQHDEVDLSPAWARAFEPPSICNGESVEVVLFLMNIEQPDAQIISAVQNAVKWFSDSRIYNTRVEMFKAEPMESKYKTVTIDKKVVTDESAPPIWTRFYELGSGRPLFCDRNSKFLYSLAEVSRERRAGYGWYTYAPQEVLDKYPDWQKKWAPEQNVLKQ